MPEYDDVFFVAIVGAAQKVGAAAHRVDKEEYTGNIVEKITPAICPR